MTQESQTYAQTQIEKILNASDEDKIKVLTNIFEDYIKFRNESIIKIQNLEREVHYLRNNFDDEY